MAQNQKMNFTPQWFSSADNSLYWKNKLPYPGYWQQDVHYDIKAVLDDSTDILLGTEKIIYVNNSPDTIKEIYFHLYQNAFTPDSYYNIFNESRGDVPEYANWESKGKGTEVEAVMLGSGKQSKSATFEIDNTIMKVNLAEPLLPDDQIEIQLRFKTYYDQTAQDRRCHYLEEWGQKVYKGVLWYPRVAVYDRRIGWDRDQHLNNEFYGDFGTFNVSINLPETYITEATGMLMNEEEVMPQSLMQQIDIKNFKDKKWGESPSFVYPETGKNNTKTWKYSAANVHDFAFITSPLFRIGEAEWKGIKAIALVQEPHAARWQNAAEYSAKCIEIFSNDITQYAWNKIIVADAEDGMEYPMITLDGDADPEYRSLLSHEIGHMWFYGMIANNETYRPFLDEGFTQFITAWASEKIDGPYVVEKKPTNKYKAKHYVPKTWRDTEVYNSYYKDAGTDFDIDLTTHSDRFVGDKYWLIYNKTGAMLYALQYTLGEELFLKSFKHYAEKWKMCHPYEEDMQKAFIESANTDLQWFFDQWMDREKAIVDYKVLKPKKLGDDQYLLRIKRKGEMQAPLDVLITDKENNHSLYYIPNTDFVKKEAGIKLKKWYGWNEHNRFYYDTIIVKGGIKNIQIDTSNRMADLYPINNSLKNKIKLGFDHQIYQPILRDKYRMYWRPDIWYNIYDGMKIGLHVEGSYLKTKWPFSLTSWYNTGLLAYAHTYSDFPETYKNKHDIWSLNLSGAIPLDRLADKLSIEYGVRHLDGVDGWKLGLVKPLRNNSKVGFYIRSSIRKAEQDRYYSIHKYENDIDFRNNNVELFYNASRSTDFHVGAHSIRLFAPFFLSDSDMTGINYNYTFKPSDKDFLPQFRMFGQLATGTRISAQQHLFLYGENPYNMFGDKFTRSAGFIPQAWGGFGNSTNHFHDGGGLNLRGMSGFAYAEVEDGDTTSFYKSTSGLALNIEWDIDNLINWKPKVISKYFHIDSYLFCDIGSLAKMNSDKKLIFGDFHADAGYGFALIIKKFGVLDKPKPLTIRIDFPLWVNHPPTNEDHISPSRWVLGFNRAF